MSSMFDITNAKVIAETPDASILIDEETGTIFFRYGRYGMAFNPKVGAWSAPLDFGEVIKPEGLLFLDEPPVGVLYGYTSKEGAIKSEGGKVQNYEELFENGPYELARAHEPALIEEMVKLLEGSTWTCTNHAPGLEIQVPLGEKCSACGRGNER